MIQTLFGSLQPESKEEKTSLFDRMKQAVTRTRENLSERIEEIVAFGKEIDSDTIDELEASLVSADLGVNTAHRVLETLREKANHKQIGDATELKRILKQEILAILTKTPAKPPRGEDGPEVVLVVGVNGTGKTTTIGKLAHAMRREGK